MHGRGCPPHISGTCHPCENLNRLGFSTTSTQAGPPSCKGGGSVSGEREGIIRWIALIAALAAVSFLTLGNTEVEGKSGARFAAAQASPQKCPYARLGLAYYRDRYTHWQVKRGAVAEQGRRPRSCADARYLAAVWAKRARHARLLHRRHIQRQQQRTLSDYQVRPGASAWQSAVREVQRPYPGTQAWLLSCSASEGGWGRWVPNSQGSGVGGWLQFMPGTFSGFVRHAIGDVRARGFLVPDSAWSWYSPLGQALAGGWAHRNGMFHHWVGSGC